MGRKIDPLSMNDIERLKAYEWPGNVRELQNVIERGVITARRGRLNLDHALPESIKGANINKSTPAQTKEHSVKTVHQFQQMERDNLLLALENTQWRISGKNGAAHLLGLPPSTLQSRMKALGIKRLH